MLTLASTSFIQMKIHRYSLNLNWTGNQGKGTINYKSYGRHHEINIEGKPTLYASADPAFRGDTTHYNPEELLLASLSGCHMLWFLHLCADNGINVVDYQDNPTATMQETNNGGGRFTEVTLQPEVTITEKWMASKLDAMHDQANQSCFIANSVNFPVTHRAKWQLPQAAKK